jgi:uncharacterized protein (TIGR03083 family)
MALSRQEVSAGIAEEHKLFAELLRSLDSNQWSRPTRCAGWAVRDVAAHVAGTMADIVAGDLEGQGSESVTARQVEQRRGRTQEDLANELETASDAAADLLAAFDEAAWAGPAPGGYPGSLGDAVEALWYDAYLHADDIRAAVGLPSERGAGLRAAVSHVATVLERRGWGPATLAFDGMEPFTVAGAGKHIEGDALAFVLAATGRADPSTVGLGPDVNVYR